MRKIFFITFVFLFAQIFHVAPVQAKHSADFQSKYTLTGVVILSRHNIRSPMSDKNSALAKITPHDWFKWTSAPSELSLRGGELETIMGQYFRRRLVDEKLITENYLPADGEIRFYANSLQRTIATAQFFSSGLFPVANVRIEHKFDVGKADPVFNPQITFADDEYRASVNKYMRAMFADKTPKNGYRLIEKVLDFKDSAFAKEEGLTHFRDDKLEFTFEVDKELAAHETLKLASQASDALTLQYYEAETPLDAAFGHEISFGDWQEISSVKDFYGEVLYSAPAVAVNVAHPLLQVMYDELSADRKFTFLCGHDSNIVSVLSALEVEEYSLPQTIECKTPIGCKLVFEKWRGTDGVDYVETELIYQSAEQLRNKTTLTLDNPPMIFPIRFKDIPQNADGLYRLEDLQKRFQKTFDAYNELPTDSRVA
ncbi:MAG: histidine-type phosphatase [Selenomonadaceae bacterium]|nr:histidine-type phosphatase [Selenomonadaceae bacterium]